MKLDKNDLVNIVKNGDYSTVVLLLLAGMEWYFNEIKYAVMSGIAALLCWIVLKTTENRRKSKKYYKQWRNQILKRKNPDGHEIGLGPSAFGEYFPEGTEEQYIMTIALLEADADLDIKRDNPQFPNVPYYIGH